MHYGYNQQICQVWNVRYIKLRLYFYVPKKKIWHIWNFKWNFKCSMHLSLFLNGMQIQYYEDKRLSKKSKGYYISQRSCSQMKNMFIYYFILYYRWIVLNLGNVISCYFESWKNHFIFKKEKLSLHTLANMWNMSHKFQIRALLIKNTK